MRKRNQLYLVVMVLLALSVGAGGLVTGIESNYHLHFHRLLLVRRIKAQLKRTWMRH